MQTIETYKTPKAITKSSTLMQTPVVLYLHTGSSAAGRELWEKIKPGFPLAYKVIEALLSLLLDMMRSRKKSWIRHHALSTYEMHISVSCFVYLIYFYKPLLQGKVTLFLLYRRRNKGLRTLNLLLHDHSAMKMQSLIRLSNIYAFSITKCKSDLSRGNSTQVAKSLSQTK